MPDYKAIVKAAKLLCIATLLFWGRAAWGSGLAGKYTIDPSKAASATNYTSFNDADSDLLSGSRPSGGTANGPGVSAAVIFDVADGRYAEQLEIDAVTGTSATNTVTFQGASKDSSKVLLTDSTNGTSKYPGFVLYLNGASFIRLKYITFIRGKSKSGSTFYDQVIYMNNQSDSDSIANCQIIGDYTSKKATGGSLIFSSRLSPFSAPATNESYNVFYNNYMKNAAYALYWEGNSTTSEEKNNVFDHNIVDSIYTYGFYFYYQEGLAVINNRINMPWGNYAIFANSFGNNTKSATSIVANNFLSVNKNTGANNAGIYAGGLDKTNIVYNNINIYGNSSNSTYAAYINGSTSGKSLNIYNNNFINLNKGATDYALYGYYWGAEDYNNLMVGAGGKSLVSYSGTIYSKLSSWASSGKGFGKHDSSVNPVYASNTDLHVSNPSINGAAKPLSYITTDIDGETRNSTRPDIGADEFTSVLINPIVKSIIKPDSGFCAGAQDVYIILANRGYYTLTNVVLNWDINGVTTAYTWTGKLASTKTDTVKIGTYSFTSASTVYKVVIYPDSANGSFVGKAPGNSDSAYFRPGLSGTYTIDNSGKGSPDYTSVHAAAADLQVKGLCGAVTFNIADGVYNESIQLNRIAGSSAVKTVTFQSASLDSSKVKIDTAWALYYNPRGSVVALNGTAYINFRYLTIANIASKIGGYYADAVTITNGAHHIILENNIIYTSTERDNMGYAVNDAAGTVENFITLRNNHIEGGFYAIQMVGNYMTGNQAEFGNIIYGNIIDSAWGYGIVAMYNDSFTIAKNKVILEAVYYGMYLYGSGINTKDTMLVYDNFIRLVGTNGSALFMNYCSPLGLYNNTVVNFTSTYSYYTALLYGKSSTATKVYNNIFANLGGGYAIEGNAAGMYASDYNDIYTTGSTLGIWYDPFGNPSSCSSLGKWQSTSGNDKNSVSVNPNLASVAKGNLHLTPGSTGVFSKGKSLFAVKDDIDGQARSKTPDIGADEVKKYAVDAAIIAIDSPSTSFCSGTKDVYVTLYNAGSDTLKSVTISWTIDGVSMSPLSWSGTLAAHTLQFVKLGSLTFTPGKFKNLLAWSGNPNGVADSNPSNDSLSGNIGTGLTGNYTLGGTSPDFTSFRDASWALSHFGVCGAVTINTRDGVYNESVTFKKIPGASRTNKVLFQSQSLDSTRVILDTAWSGGTYQLDRAFVVRFDGAEYITLRKMSLFISPLVIKTFADVVELANGASYDSLEDDVIYENPGSIITWGSAVYNDPTSVESHDVLYNNIIYGGTDVIYYSGYTGKGGAEQGNIIEHNMIDSGLAYDIICYYQDGMLISSNTINMQNGCGYAGIYANGFTNTDTSYIMNNFITMRWQYSDGLYSTGNTLLNVLNNSIFIASANTGYYSAYFTGTSPAKVKAIDNIFFNNFSGTSIYGDQYGLTNSDYNDIYSSGALGNWNGTSCTYLADWEKASKMDAHSVSGDPSFLNSAGGDLHLTAASVAVRHKGLHLGNVKTDIDGQDRKAIPDIGADEIPRDSDDVGVTAIISPVNLSCGDSSVIAGVKLTNAGIKKESGFNIHILVSGSASSGTTYLFKDTLRGSKSGPAHDTLIYIRFSPRLNTIKGGRYIFTAYTDLSTDGDNSNDTSVINDSIVPKPIAGFVAGNICAGIPFTINDISKGASAYRYYIFDNSGTKIDSSFLANPGFSYKRAGRLRVQQFITSAGKCQDSISRFITVDTVSANFTHSIPDAAGNVNFKAADSVLTYYNWSFGDSSLHGINYKTSHTYKKDGWYHVVLNVSGANGCSTKRADSVNITITGILSGEDNENSPEVYPNPFSDYTTISYSLNKPGRVDIRVYDLEGRPAAVLVNSYQSEGKYILHFMPNNYNKESSGTYILRIMLGNSVFVKPLLMMK